MDISELKGTVLQRFQELTDTEIGIVQSMEEHPIGEVIMKLIGPELTEIFAEPEDETEQMLADRVNAMPQDLDREPPMLMDDPQRDTMPQEFGRGDGRSQGGNELPPMRARDPMEDRKGEREMASR